MFDEMPTRLPASRLGTGYLVPEGIRGIPARRRNPELAASNRSFGLEGPNGIGVRKVEQFRGPNSWFGT